jgi:cytochrome c biogenesis protein ResB
VPKLFAALRSVKLAIILIAYLAVSGIVVSITDRTQNFYGSAYFLAPAFLFFANLATCTAARFARELKRGKARRHGPDILHLGLIVLLLGAVFGQVARQVRPDWQGIVRLGKGEAVELPGGRLLKLIGLERE